MNRKIAPIPMGYRILAIGLGALFILWMAVWY